MEGLEPTLQSATREELLAEIVRLAAVNSEQAEQIERLKAAVVELQRRLGRPKKDSANSSVSPSREEKENKKPKEKKKRRKRGFGAWRHLSEDPDEIKDIKADSCSHCDADLSAEHQNFHSAREKTEVIIETHITQVRMYECKCPHCGKRTAAKAPEGFGGSPFGTSVEALILLLHYTHAMSCKRLEGFLSQMFSLKISQGAIRNIIKAGAKREFQTLLPVGKHAEKNTECQAALSRFQKRTKNRHDLTLRTEKIRESRFCGSMQYLR